MEKIKVLLAGLPGKMCTLIAEKILATEDIELLNYAFTGEKIEQQEVEIGGVKIKLLPPGYRETFLESSSKDFVIVDFTQPDWVNKNAELYCKYGLRFVMGTTGGDREKLVETVKNSQSCVVIAPNMGIPLVVFQAMLQYAGENFPNALEGFSLKIIESHQATKKDVSGTAKAWAKIFEKLGVKLEEIESIRNHPKQRSLGVTEEALEGHGYHWYFLQKGNVALEISTKVDGRDVYAEGNLKAIRFLSKKFLGQGVVYTMIDVLKGE